jgi:serine/threonine protein kinase
MAFKNIDELQRRLLGLQLVTPAQLDECLARLGPRNGSSNDLLRQLKRKSYLTPYQVGSLEKGNDEGLVLGGYKLLYKNASGSFARVFRACSISDGRMVGLKLLRERWAADPTAVAQFQREAELGMKLHHKNIVPIYELASEGDFHYFTMDFIEGGNIRDFLRIRKKLSDAEATHYLLDMCEGLEHALKLGITHRDIKPTNVLMSSRGVAKLVDFGLAGDHLQLARKSNADSILRALEYATLEKATNAPWNDPRSDLFFVGAMFYELLTGTPPYPRTRSRTERKDISRYTNIRPLRSIEPNVSRTVLEIVERLMKVSPEQRYQSPSAVISDLYAALSELGEPLDAANSSVHLPVPNGNSNNGDEESLPTILCVESRSKQQNLLRDYLSKRGFRVLVLNDFKRGLNRLQENPPDCVILMGESMGRDAITAYEDAVRVGEPNSVVCILILGDKQSRWQKKLEQTRTSRVMIQPITLRDLRREIHLAFQRRNRDARGAGSQETEPS